MAKVTLCDVNVWLALVLPVHGHHKAAKAWWDDLGGESTGCWQHVLGCFTGLILLLLVLLVEFL